MGLAITVMHHKGLPPAEEPICSSGTSPGSVLGSVSLLGYKTLPHLDRETACEALLKTIAELDKGEAGIFNTDFWVECDLRWSGHRSMNKDIEHYRVVWTHMGIEPRAYWSRMKRDQHRRDLMRFFLYYKAGYNITYEP